MKKTLFIVILLVAVLVLMGLWSFWKNPVDPEAAEEAAIAQELESIDLGGVDKEFQDIDQDLNAL